MVARTVASLILALALAGCSLVPSGRSDPAPRPATAPPVASSAAGKRCLAALEQTGARFTPQPDRYFAAGCSTLNAVRVTQLRGDAGDFAVSQLGPVACPAANALAGWARYGVDRAARQILGSPLVRIETMGSYSCRNVAGSSRRSAHARAEAIDVSGFVLADGRRIVLLEDWKGGSAAERRFLRTVQSSACKRFATVLGPDYDAAHADHFHLEVAGSRTGRRAFCR